MDICTDEVPVESDWHAGEHKLMGFLWGGEDWRTEDCKVNNIVRNLWLATGIEAGSDEEAERIIRAIYAEGVSYDPNAEEVTSDGLFGMDEGKDHTMDCHPEAVLPADFYMARIDHFCHGANHLSPGWRYSEDEAYAVPMGEFRKLLRAWLAGGQNVDIEDSFDFTDRFAYVSYYEDQACDGVARVSSGNSLPLLAPVGQYVRLMQRI